MFPSLRARPSVEFEGSNVSCVGGPRKVIEHVKESHVRCDLQSVRRRWHFVSSEKAVVRASKTTPSSSGVFDGLLLAETI